MNYLLLIVAGIAGIFIGRRMAKRKIFAPKSKEEIVKMQNEAREAIMERTEDRKEKILEMMRQSREDFSAGCNLREGENKKGINREEVEKLLDISKDTAHKYLNELEKEGKIKQIGFSGKNVHYILA